MKLLVTGAAGFMGSDFVHFALGEDGVRSLTVLDALTYAGRRENLAGVEGDPRFRFVHGDVADPATVRDAMAGCDTVVHFAAETHVDRSIDADQVFIRTNVEGTRALLAAAREAGVRRFVLISTDEVYGHLEWRDPAAEPTDGALARFRSGDPEAPEFFTERSPIRPRSPYSASKAGADHLALAYHATHGLPVVVTRASNNYGARQFPEKLIPLLTTRALAGETLPVYGDGLNVRDWLHVRDHSMGVWGALHRGRSGEVYNLGGRSERTNLQVVRGILAALDLPESRIEFVPDRPGHDRRYAIDTRKAEEELGWAPTRNFEEGLAETVEWYRENAWK